jgi:hypothetical protein
MRRVGVQLLLVAASISVSCVLPEVSFIAPESDGGVRDSGPEDSDSGEDGGQDAGEGGHGDPAGTGGVAGATAGSGGDPHAAGRGGVGGAGAPAPSSAGQNADPVGPPPLATPASIQTVIVDADSPVLLFTDGSACRDTQFVVDKPDLETHRAMHPNAWSRWKMLDGKVALSSSDGIFRTPDSQTLYAAITRGFTLDRTFVSVNTNVLSSQEAYTFGVDSTYSKIVCSTEPVTPFTLKAGGVCPGNSTETAGRYEIDGYTITSIGGDNSSAVFFPTSNPYRQPFFYSPDDGSTLFIGQRKYVRWCPNPGSCP